jgi:hypothetical protein
MPVTVSLSLMVTMAAEGETSVAPLALLKVMVKVSPPSAYTSSTIEIEIVFEVSPGAKAFKRLRAEIPAWHYPPEERGKPVPKMRPRAVFDDCITTVRYPLVRWGVTSAPLTIEQKIEAALPEPLKSEAIAAEVDPERKLKLMMAQQIKIKRLEQHITKRPTRNRLVRKLCLALVE